MQIDFTLVYWCLAILAAAVVYCKVSQWAESENRGEDG